MKDDREVVFPEEFIGVIGGGDRSYIPKLAGSVSFDSVDATFEALPHLLMAGIEYTTSSGTVDGTGSGYVYTYTIPHSTAPTIKSYTIRAGDDQQAEIMEYSIVQNFTLEGNAGEALMMSADWFGRQITNGSYSTSVSVPTVESILASKATMYLDAVSGTYGATAVSDTLLSATLNFNNLIQPKFTMDGQLYFDFHYVGNREITGSLTFEHNASAVTEKTNWRAETPRLLRLLFAGTALTTSTATHATKKLIVDLPIKWESFDAISDQDGNSTVTGTFRSRYNATVANAGKFVVVLNSTTSIP
jgi:hypothetical protein